jgi:hypothetical protein
MAKKHMRKCPPSLAIKEMQVNTLRFHLTPLRIASIKNTNNKKYGREYREKEPSYIDGGNVSQTNCFGKQYGGFLKI